jgi:hypothetical protein
MGYIKTNKQPSLAQGMPGRASRVYKQQQYIETGAQSMPIQTKGLDYHL